ncbi:MAG: hypothetical protein WCP68_10485, partial [Enhydrobacter sp.]
MRHALTLGFGSADREKTNLFRATVGRFEAAADRAVIDGLVTWIEDRYRGDLQKRSSRHVYVRTLPAPAACGHRR